MPLGIQIVPETAGGAWEAEEEDWAIASMMNQAESLEPTYEEVKKRSDWPKWREAMQAELRSLETNKMWSIVDRPSNMNVVSSKWVFRIKKNEMLLAKSKNTRLGLWRAVSPKSMVWITTRRMHP